MPKLWPILAFFVMIGPIQGWIGMETNALHFPTGEQAELWQQPEQAELWQQPPISSLVDRLLAGYHHSRYTRYPKILNQGSGERLPMLEKLGENEDLQSLEKSMGLNPAQDLSKKNYQIGIKEYKQWRKLGR